MSPRFPKRRRIFKGITNNDTFTICPNSTVLNKELSDADLGFLVRMLQLPEDWDFRVSWRLENYPEDGRHSITTRIDRLVKFGFLAVIARRDQSGQFSGMEYYAFAHKNDCKDFLESLAEDKTIDWAASKPANYYASTESTDAVFGKPTYGEPTPIKKDSKKEGGEKEGDTPYKSPKGDGDGVPAEAHFGGMNAAAQEYPASLQALAAALLPLLREPATQNTPPPPPPPRAARAKKAAATSAEAEAIYLAYPLRVGRANALRAIDKALRKTDAATLLEATNAFAAAWKDAPRDQRQFIPHPATWFNGERWRDDRSTWGPKATATAATTRKFRAKNGKFLDSPDDVESYEWHNAGLADHMWTLPERLWDKYPELR